QWSRLIDRAALQQFCDLFVARLGRTKPSPVTWPLIVRTSLVSPAVAPLEGTAAHIARAALTVLGREGGGGLTHRAVASEANV
ncbi:hypothetical protein RGC28_08435, partial [Helicobacter pylori]|uniref:hypothetical protein n=1 Tax=Helicobacter pylori TaxID=210 RepID=UPI002929B114